MRSILLFLFVSFSGLGDSFGQRSACDDCIEWSANAKLNWSDFKGRPNKLSPNAALTDSGMSIELNCDDRTSEVIIKCFFNRNKSWSKEKESDYLLEHEQLHFDITELFVRKLRKQLNDLGNDCKRLNAHVEKYYNENYKEFVAYQDAYDRETKHSLDREKQKLWKEKIARELDRLKPYASLASR